MNEIVDLIANIKLCTSYYCRNCWSLDITILCRVCPNAPYDERDFEYLNQESIDSMVCDTCGGQGCLATLLDLWIDFCKCKTTCDDKLEDDLGMFPAGTPMSEVIEWFKEQSLS